MQDILNRKDIERLVAIFYEKIKKDDKLSLFFKDVIPVNWETHIPLMCSFWENVLFYTGNYEGNPLETHKKLHLLKPTTSADFERWIKLFDDTLDQNFKGENTEKIRQHAKAITSVMMEKI